MKRERTALRPVTLVEAVYKGLQVSREKSGDFLREVAALLLVFIPLDLWKNELTFVRSMSVIGVSAIIFFVGLCCEFTAIAIKRGRDTYEEERNYESS